MKLIVFNPYFFALNERILALAGRFKRCRAVFAHSHPEFETAMVSCLSGETIVAFFIGRYRDLLFIEELHKQFVDVKLLMNLSEELKTHEKRVRKLFPRLLSFQEECRCLPESPCSCLMPQAVYGILRETNNRTAYGPNIV